MEHTRIQLPGFGLPVNYYDRHEDSFPSSVNPKDIEENRTLLELTTLREFTMLHFMNYITDKPGWRTVVFSDDIAYNWKRDAMGMPQRDISGPMMDWVIEELRYKAKLFEDIGAVIVYTGHVVKSDSIISESRKLELQAAAAVLEDVPHNHMDWNPRSNGKVLNLVDPSLYPLVYGRTRVLETGRTSLEDCIVRCGEGQTTQIPHRAEVIQFGSSFDPYNQNFQWLPCMVDISGEHCKITSYINNLHPLKYKGLYRLIEHVIDAAIPLWSVTLRPIGFYDWSRYLRVHSFRSHDTLPVTALPEPDKFEPPTEPDPTVNLKEEYAESGLQVIVKLENIHLTPENPFYEGRFWGAEGQLNEHICATALYYYSSENIGDSYLSFRQRSPTEVADLQYPQGNWFPVIFGCEPGGSSLQFIGNVEIREGRLLTFPNIIHHQVHPFSLVDRTKPGHLKILALFLVDPHLPILSTANVPCQQRDWWRDHIEQLGTALDRLPVELRDIVFNGVTGDFPFAPDEAEDMRLELMDERSAFAIRLEEEFHRYIGSSHDGDSD